MSFGKLTLCPPVFPVLSSRPLCGDGIFYQRQHSSQPLWRFIVWLHGQTP